MGFTSLTCCTLGSITHMGTSVLRMVAVVHSIKPANTLICCVIKSEAKAIAETSMMYFARSPKSILIAISYITVFERIFSAPYFTVSYFINQKMFSQFTKHSKWDGKKCKNYWPKKSKSLIISPFEPIPGKFFVNSLSSFEPIFDSNTGEILAFEFSFADIGELKKERFFERRSW